MRVSGIRLKMVGLLTALAIGAGILYALMPGHSAASLEVEVPSGMTVTSVMVSSPSPVVISKEVVIRSDGAFRETRTNFHQEKRLQSTFLTIWNSDSGRKTWIGMEAGVMSSTIAEAESLNSVGCTEDILKLPQAGEFLGYKTLERTGAKERTAHRVLYAPQLNCLQLLFEVQMLNDDGAVIGTASERVTGVKLGEPDPILFEVPAGLVEAPPSVAAQMQMTAVDSQAQNCDACPAGNFAPFFETADHEYHAARWID